MPTSTSSSGTTPIPSPTVGNGPFGLVPGPISIPNPGQDLASQYPNLGQTNTALSGDILSKLNGYLSPTTLSALQNHFGATAGVQSGMPGSGLSWNNVYGNIIGASENQKQQGIQDYNQTIPTVSGTQTVSPALQTQIQEQNAVNASAPSPAAAASYAQSLFNQYLSSLRGPAGGTGRSMFNPAGGSGSSYNPSDLGFGGVGSGSGFGATAGGVSPFDTGGPISDTDFGFGAPVLSNNGGPIQESDYGYGYGSDYGGY